MWIDPPVNFDDVGCICSCVSVPFVTVWGLVWHGTPFCGHIWWCRLPAPGRAVVPIFTPSSFFQGGINLQNRLGVAAETEAVHCNSCNQRTSSRRLRPLAKSSNISIVLSKSRPCVFHPPKVSRTAEHPDAWHALTMAALSTWPQSNATLSTASASLLSSDSAAALSTASASLDSAAALFNSCSYLNSHVYVRVLVIESESDDRRIQPPHAYQQQDWFQVGCAEPYNTTNDNSDQLAHTANKSWVQRVT